MQIYHYFMLIGGIISAISFVVGILFFLGAMGSSNENQSGNWIAVAAISAVFWLISTGFALFGFIDYLKN